MPRILFIDAYDSFSNNIVSLLREQLSVAVEVIRIDDARFILNDDAFCTFLSTFDAAVVGPGPGHPARPEDVGLISRLWSLADEHLLPVLGVCLGFQSLCLAAGAQVVRLQEPRHGRIAPIQHAGEDIFEGLIDMHVTQYHSLHVDLCPTHEASVALPFWSPTVEWPLLKPTAWTCDDAENGPILMAVHHTTKPFWGVQFHPESICTNEAGQSLISNWWAQARLWRAEHRVNYRHLLTYANASPSTLSLASEANTLYDTDDEDHDTRVKACFEPHSTCVVNWTSCALPSGIQVDAMAEAIRSAEKDEVILLESGTRDGKPLNPETGRYGIVGIPSVPETSIRYYTATKRLQCTGLDTLDTAACTSVYDVFEKIQTLVTQRQAVNGAANIPFWGGFVGYVSYEAGLETINVRPPETEVDRPDIWFQFLDRSVVVDHVENQVYFQSIREDDDEWIASTKALLLDLVPMPERVPEFEARPVIISEPEQKTYKAKILACQDHLRAGSSYELCLTDQTCVKTEVDSWSIYRRLRSANPAPFGGYLRFTGDGSDSLTVVGSSPERFLSWDRTGRCQFRPIKGTVKKEPGVTYESAAEILNSDKERAENLMIVDLIRHDLWGVPGVENVHVPKLMVIEEYETVYQLVSVIEGRMPTTSTAQTGVSVLSRSLPPGSMTGAPKKRSCELLRKLENDKARGLYSGVLGYLDVGGGGDFAVVIRTAFKWDREGAWRVGAGGAITALSETESEWAEMSAKKERVMDVLMAP